MPSITFSDLSLGLGVLLLIIAALNVALRFAEYMDHTEDSA
jgi:hypothetical protein